MIYTEEQVIDTNWYGLDYSISRQAQRMSIVNRYILTLSFKLAKAPIGTTGDIIFTIRKHSDDTILASKIWGDASELPLHTYPVNSSVWCTVIFDPPVLINDDVKLCCEYYLADGNVIFRIVADDVKENERAWHYLLTWWSDGVSSNYDATYRYTYIVKEFSDLLVTIGKG